MSGTATRTRHQNTSPAAQRELGAGLVRQVLPVADQTGARSGREDGHTRKGAPGIVAKGKQEEREWSMNGKLFWNIPNSWAILKVHAPSVAQIFLFFLASCCNVRQSRLFSCATVEGMLLLNTVLAPRHPA